MKTIKQKQGLITVCDKCLQASCWTIRTRRESTRTTPGRTITVQMPGAKEDK